MVADCLTELTKLQVSREGLRVTVRQVVATLLMAHLMDKVSHFRTTVLMVAQLQVALRLLVVAVLVVAALLVLVETQQAQRVAQVETA